MAGNLAALLLLIMMSVTTIDVIGRSLGKPIPGAFEVTELLLLAVIFSGLPRACLNNSHVSVTVISGFFPYIINVFLTRFFAAIGAVVLAAIAWSMMNLGIEKIQFRDTTPFLGIPVGPVALVVSILIAFSAISEAKRAIFQRTFVSSDMVS